MIKIILFYGSVISILMTLNILLSLWINPRMWIQDLPEKLRKKIPPKTKAEKLQTLLVLLPFMILFFLGPVIAITDVLDISPLKPDFIHSLLIAYGINLIFNLMDLLVIDWLVICTITPEFARIPGIEIGEIRDYRKHGIDFLKGLFIIVIPSLISGSAGYWINT